MKIDGSPRKYEVTFALSGAASAKVSCKGQGAYDASLPARIEVPAQAAVEEARAKGAVARRPVRAARPSAAPGGEGGSGGAAPAGDRVAELYLKARGLEEANVLGAEALYRRILEDGKGTKHALMAADRLKAITPMVARAKEKQDAGASERKARRYFQLAENMLKAENYEVARAYYMRIIRDYPESGYAARARERLQDIR